jgi:hypothetical protein
MFTVVVACLLLTAPARGDGPTLRFSTSIRTADISVFTDPTPPHTGALDVSVMLQPRPAGSKRSSAAFQISAFPVNSPEKRIRTAPIEVLVMNKLFRVAELDLQEPGPWRIEVEIDSQAGGLQTSFDINVEDGNSDWMSPSVWISLPVLAVALFAIHRRRVNSRRKVAPGQASTAAPPAVSG